jgi:hypothetical protein
MTEQKATTRAELADNETAAVVVKALGGHRATAAADFLQTWRTAKYPLGVRRASGQEWRCFS